MGLYDRDYGRDDSDSAWRPEVAKPKSATVILIGINVAVFLVEWLTKSETFADSFAVTPGTLVRPWLWWQFITYGFLHGNLNHILFNMVGLFIFGRPMEQRLGFAEFLKFYLAAVFVGGVIGSLIAVLMGSSVAIIGASGAVVATTILFACFYPNVEILLFFVLPIKAWVLCVGFVAFDLFGALGGRGGNTAFEVHLAGAAFGLLYYFQRWSFDWISTDALTNWRRNLSQRSRRMKLKLHDPDRKLQQQAVEADRILAKIHESGEASLTRAERKVLEAYSRRQREKRGG